MVSIGRKWSYTVAEEAIDSDLRIMITFSVANPEIDYVSGRKSLPESDTDLNAEPEDKIYTMLGELSWDIAKEADYAGLASMYEEKLKELHRQVSEEISNEKWFQIFLDDEDKGRASVAAYLMGDTELVGKTIREEYEFQKGPNGEWSSREQAKKLADFFQVKLE